MLLIKLSSLTVQIAATLVSLFDSTTWEKATIIFCIELTSNQSINVKDLILFSTVNFNKSYQMKKRRDLRSFNKNVLKAVRTCTTSAATPVFIPSAQPKQSKTRCTSTTWPSSSKDSTIKHSTLLSSIEWRASVMQDSFKVRTMLDQSF